MNKEIKATSPNQLQLAHMRTRKSLRLIKDKCGTFKALQQMDIGNYALFTDGENEPVAKRAHTEAASSSSSTATSTLRSWGFGS
jgi:hypothetical protein